MNKILLLCVAAALLLPCASAQSFISQYCKQSTGTNVGIVQLTAPWYCSQINQQIASVWSKWEPLALAVVMVSFSIATVIFMAGIVLKNDRIRTFGIGEIYEALASMLIVVLFLFISAVMFGLLPSAFFIGPINPYTTALTFIAQTINTTSTVAGKIFVTAMVAGYYSQISIQITGEGISTLPIYIIGLLSYVIEFSFFWPAWVITTFMVDALISLYTQFYMIVFFLYAAVPVFLIPGVIFRAFLPTRSLGGKMMAIAIGFFFLMPTLYSIAYASTNVSLESSLNAASAALTKYGSGVSALQNAISPSAPLEMQLANIKQTFTTFWLMIMFYPVLILTITYLFIIQLAEIIGGMARSSQRLRGLV